MAAPDPLDEYSLSYHEFYAELPGSTDYLNDIDPDIQDEHDSDGDGSRGLSAEQVSEIARDSLGTSAAPEPDDDEPQLFPPNSDTL